MKIRRRFIHHPASIRDLIFEVDRSTPLSPFLVLHSLEYFPPAPQRYPPKRPLMCNGNLGYDVKSRTNLSCHLNDGLDRIRVQ